MSDEDSSNSLSPIKNFNIQSDENDYTHKDKATSSFVKDLIEERDEFWIKRENSKIVEEAEE
jgi:hypothetical protein